MSTIGNFNNSVVAVYRERLRRYFFLKWDSGNAMWFPHHGIANEDSLIFKRSRAHGAGGNCFIQISTTRGRSKRVNVSNLFGDYLLHISATNGTRSCIPVLKPERLGDFPPRYKDAYPLRGEDVAGAEMMTDEQLWTPPVAPAPAPAPAPVPMEAPPPAPAPAPLPAAEQRQTSRGLIYRVTLKPIPQRIAWILAEEASKRGETCSITMDEITPLTAAVTTCFHVFDADAIDTWLDSKQMRECPMCKRTCYATRAYTEEPVPRTEDEVIHAA